MSGKASKIHLDLSKLMHLTINLLKNLIVVKNSSLFAILKYKFVVKDIHVKCLKMANGEL